MIHASGLLRAGLVEWLAPLDQVEEPVLHELSDIDLLQNELQWQLNSVRRTPDCSGAAWQYAGESSRRAHGRLGLCWPRAASFKKALTYWSLAACRALALLPLYRGLWPFAASGA